MKSSVKITMLILTCSLASGGLLAGELSRDQIAIDVNALQRDSGNDTIYLYNNNGTVNNSVDDIALAGTGSFSDKADVGYRLSASKNINSRWSINGGILSSELAKTDNFVDPAHQLEIFRLPITANFDAANSVSTDYSSKLQNAELNAVYRYSDNLDLFAGVARVTLDERFKIVSDDSVAAGIGTYTMNTSNDMLGPQIGLAYSYKPGANYSIYFIGKLAWLNNDANQNQLVDDAPAFTRNNSASDSHSSTMYDVKLGLNYYFTQQLAMNLGYQFIKVSDVALAESQFNTTVAGSNTVNTSDSVSWDGFTLGLSYYF